MTKTIKKVGIPTSILRNATKDENGLKHIKGIFNGVMVELTQDIEVPYFYGIVDLKGFANVQFQNDMIISNEKATSTIWLNNKSAYTKFKKGLIEQLELNDLIINKDGTYTSKYVYAFISNENDFTLEDID